MQMNMKDGLSCRRVAIHHNPVTILTKTRLLRHFFGSEVKIADLLPVGISQVVDSRNVFAWNDQNVGWRLGINVAKGEYFICLEDDVGVEFS